MNTDGSTTFAAKQAEATKDTLTLGKFFSLLPDHTANEYYQLPGEVFTLTDPFKPSLSYSGPVTVINGQQDNPFCGG